MKTTFAIPSVAALLGIGFLIGAAALQVRSSPHLITVTGESRLVGEPDTARLMFGVRQHGRTVAEAQAKMAAAMGKVVPAVQQAGVRKEDISTSQLSISQGWGYAKDRPGGYDVSATVTIVVRDVQKVGLLVDRAVASGLNRLEGVGYDALSQDWRKKGLQAALDDARGTAEAIAAAAHAHLGQVVSVQQSGQEQASPAEEYYGRGAAAESRAMDDESPRALTRALPGQRSFTTRVRVVYELG